MQRIARFAMFTVLVLVIALGAAACGDDSEVKTDPKPPSESVTMPPTPSGVVSPSASAQPPSGAVSSPAPPTSSVARVGDTITLVGTTPGNKLDATVTKIVDPAQPDNPYGSPDPGSRFVAVQWRITNTGSNPIDVGPTYGSAVIDTLGQQFSPTYETTTAGPAYPSSATIPPGGSRLGYVTYELPRQSQPHEIQFDPTGGLGQVGQWTLG